jgi:preprotein translocase subunit SecG
VLVLAVLVTQSRGGALGLGAGGVAFLGLRLSRGGKLSARRASLVLVLAVFSALLVLALLPAEARSRLATLAGAPDPSGTFRLGLWNDALAAVRESPLLGHGLGTFADALPPHKTVAGELRVEHAENDFLEILVEGGLLAGAWVAWGFALLVRWSRGAWARHGLERGLALGAAAAVVGLSVHSLVDFPLRLPAGAAAAVTAVTLLSALGGEGPVDAPRSRIGAIALLTALLASAAHVFFAPPLPPRAGSSPAVQLATRSGVPGPAPARARAAEGRLRRHLRSRPGDAEGWALLAWLRARAGARDEAVALARHAAALDPRREALRSYAHSLAGPRVHRP